MYKNHHARQLVWAAMKAAHEAAEGTLWVKNDASRDKAWAARDAGIISTTEAGNMAADLTRHAHHGWPIPELYEEAARRAHHDRMEVKARYNLPETDPLPCWIER